MTRHGRDNPIPSVTLLAHRLGRRLTIRRLVSGAIWGLLAGGAAALVLLAVDRLLLHARDARLMDPWLAGVTLAGAIAGCLLALRHRLGDADLLAMADRAAGTRELLVTAAELAAATARGPLEVGILARAEAVCARVTPAEVVPLRVPRAWRVALVLIAILLASPFIPKYVPRAVARELKEKKLSVGAGEKMKEDLARLQKEQQKAETPAEAKAVTEKAVKLADAMAKGDLDRLTALEKAGDVEEDIGKARKELGIEQVQSSFERAAREIERQGLGTDLSKALSTMDAAAIEQELKSLADQLTKPETISKEELSHVAEAFSRMSKALERQSQQDLAGQAKDIADKLAQGKTAEAAEALEKMAGSEQLARQASDEKSSQELARALDASQETKAAVDKLQKQDAAGTRQALKDLAKALKEGKSAQSFDEKSMQSLAKAMKQLSSDLKGTELQGLSEKLAKAADKLEQGDRQAAADMLKDVSAKSLQACSSIQQGDKRLDDLSRVLSELRAQMGEKAGEGGKLGKPGTMGQGPAGPDYGVGTSHDEQQGAPQDSVHHNADRTGTATSHWQEKYEKKYESIRLDGAEFSSSFVKGQNTGAAEYIEFRGLPGKEEPSIQVGAPPANYRKAADDALSSEEIPPGYRDQIKQYFDTIAPAEAPASAPTAAPAAPAPSKGEGESQP